MAGMRLKEAREWDSVVLFVGRLVPYKGLEFLIRAIGHTNAILVVAGEGKEKASLQREAFSIGVGDRVEFVGPVAEAELPAYYHACDVFVLRSVSVNEAYGIVQLEAMASGKPVISTALPTGVRSLNVHGETGLVVPPRDEKALAEAIASLLDHPHRATLMGAQGGQRAMRDHSIAQMADATAQLYRDVIAVRP